MKKHSVPERSIRAAIRRIITLLLLAGFFITGAGCFFAVGADEGAAVKTIPVTEIKKADQSAAETISLEQVEKARVITAERIYWLGGLWALIIVVIILLRIQLRHDEKLYEQGYYSRDL